VTISLISIILIIIFIIAIVVYFAVFNQASMHNISVGNNCDRNVYVRFGVLQSSGMTTFLPDRLLKHGETWLYKSTPGAMIVIQGYHEGDLAPISSPNPLTTVKLVLSGQGFQGKGQITDGNVIIDNLELSTDSVDKYGVSMQDGYNIPISILSTGNNNKDSSNPFSCIGPNWDYTIAATGPHACPTELVYPGNIISPEGPLVYQSCTSPCTSLGGTAYCCAEPNICVAEDGCQSQWPEQSYYNLFAGACAKCMITDCDQLNYSCSSVGGLTEYSITFCPN
jgi:hypothetical protein